MAFRWVRPRASIEYYVLTPENGDVADIRASIRKDEDGTYSAHRMRVHSNSAYEEELTKGFVSLEEIQKHAETLLALDRELPR